MKLGIAPEKLFQLKAARHCSQFDGKTVEFFYELEGNLVLLTGRLVLHASDGRESVFLHYIGRLASGDPLRSSYTFRLSQAHLKSIFPAAKPGSKMSLLMERPLLPRDC